MSSNWQAVNIYTPHVEPLLLELVGPFFSRYESHLDRGFWERHHAGGPHVRVRVSGPTGTIARAIAELSAQAREWLACHPGRISPATYSEARTRALLRLEGVEPESQDLRPHHNAVLPATYPDRGKHYASDSARKLYEDFRRLRGPLALDLMRAQQPRHELVLGCYIVLALYVGAGDLARGSVSFKSHWSGFFSSCPSEALLSRITDSFRRDEHMLCAFAKALRVDWLSDRLSHHALFSRWLSILYAMTRCVNATLAQGDAIFQSLQSVDQVDSYWQVHSARSRRRSDFIELLAADPRFLLNTNRAASFQRPRALVNFLYELIASLGISPIEKMVMCHHAHKIAEAISGVDLNEIAAANIRYVVEHNPSARPGRRDTHDRDEE